jgi:hypothetical protein
MGLSKSNAADCAPLRKQRDWVGTSLTIRYPNIAKCIHLFGKKSGQQLGW